MRVWVVLALHGENVWRAREEETNAEAVGWDGKAGATATEGDPARERFGFFFVFSIWFS